jgi:exopolyphosphatase/guanosine-5'-triphosphate,3'-diphosphate pyrophosphatase
VSRAGPRQPADALTVAAVDLGSNSFHLVIGRVLDQEIQVVDRMREQVMLADGLDESVRLTEESQQRALACLERIGQRLRSVPSVRVRAVATNTLRRAKNADSFRVRAQAVLGHPIEIVSGQEEARLIFLGVAHDQYSSAARLLVDIGGGSTEVILGEGYEVLRSHSLYMGCVNYSRQFFPGGVLRKEHFRAAEIAAALELRTIQRELRRLGWESALGSSGTIVAVQEILRMAGASEGPITWDGLKWLRRVMIDAGAVERLALAGLKAERAGVLPGGLAILRAVFRCLEVRQMSAASGAMREGVLHDLVGRIRHEDIRDPTIRRLVERYHVDLAQARRVEQVALRLLGHASRGFDLEEPVLKKLLSWASQLHEIGLAVSHTGYHKHGAYLVQHSYLPGFSADDQRMLAAIVRAQRRKLPRGAFVDVPPPAVRSVSRLCVLFRLAVLLNRSRTPQELPALEVDADWRSLRLLFPAGWSEAHPLTRADLELEAGYLRDLAVELTVEERPRAAARRTKRTPARRRAGATR